MAGDGINDALALTKACAGIALGMGTGVDVAMNRSQVTLVRGRSARCRYGSRVIRASIANIKQNPGFTFVYNSFGVPLAAGLHFPFTGWLLSPMIAVFAMSPGSAWVIAHALRLRRPG